jgi:hypothetical protein
MTRPGQPRQRQALDEAAFSALYQRLRNAASWGADDRRGALNNITQAQVAAAASDCPLPPTGYRRQLYNGVAADIVTAAGAFELSIDVARDGIRAAASCSTSRGYAERWLEPGDHVTAGDLMEAEQAQHVRVGQGDLLFVRAGHRRRRTELGPRDAAHARAGLYPAALEFGAERRSRSDGRGAWQRQQQRHHRDPG